MQFEKIKSDLKSLKKYEVVVFGSFLTAYFTPKSDIDIAIISRNFDHYANIELLKNILGKQKSIYDVKIFELLPLNIKISIADNFEVIFGDKIEISEYFYFYRKLWNDEKIRFQENQFEDSKEQIKIINSLKSE